MVVAVSHVQKTGALGSRMGGQYLDTHACAVLRYILCSLSRDNFHFLGPADDNFMKSRRRHFNHVQLTEMSEGVAALTDDMIFSCVLMVGRYSA